MGSLVSQAFSVLGSPLGLTVLALATLAVVGILVWAFWGQNKISTRPDVRSNPAKIVPPPLLAPSVFTGGASAVVHKDSTLRNAVLGLLGLAAVFGAYKMLTVENRGGDQYAHYDRDYAHSDDLDALNTEQGYAREASFTTSGGGVSTAAVASVINPACNEGFTDEEGRAGYRLCAEGQQVRFDKIDFSRGGLFLLNASWNGSSGYSLMAANQPAPFAFDEHVAMRGAADIDVHQYDAFLAIGLAEGAIDKDADPMQISAERAYSLGRYALTALRGETDADCMTRARVMAISLGASNDYTPDAGPMKPVLIGVRFDRRFAAADRDLNEAVSAFLRSRGTSISGYDLAAFNARDVLFNEVACPRLN